MSKSSIHHNPVFWFLGLWIVVFSVESRAQVANDFGTYNLFPQGSARSMALGGAYTALSDDQSGLIYNPSGLALSNERFDIGGGFSRLNNREAYRDFSGDHSQSVDFLSGGAVLRLGSYAIGAGLSYPYQIALKDFDKSAEIRIQSYDFALAKAFAKKYSLGVGYHIQKLTSKYKNDTTSTDQSDEASASFFTIGASYRNKKGGIGFSFSPHHEYELDEKKNTLLGNETWFSTAKVPDKLSIGVFWHMNEHVMLVADYDRFSSMKDIYYPGSQNFYGQIKILEKEKTVLHGGIEWRVIQSTATDFTLRGGAYQEPQRLDPGGSRNHYTLGIEVRFGPAVLTVSFDQAEKFNNSAQGFSISYGSI
jgi:hypothetical protein